MPRGRVAERWASARSAARAPLRRLHESALPQPGMPHMSAARSRFGVGVSWALLSALGCGDDERVPVLNGAGTVIAVDAVSYGAMPRAVLDSLDVVCPLTRSACPPEDLLLSARAPDGTIALADRIGGVFLYPSDGSPARQISFDKNPARRTGFGGFFVAVGDSAWRLHRPDDVKYLAFDRQGRALSTVSTAIRIDYAGSAAGGELFVRLLVPGGKEVGDTVLAEIEVVAPRSRAGEVVARLPVPATRREGSDMNPLPPFVTAARVWGVTPDERLFFTDAESYSVLVLDTARNARRLIVDAPRRPVDPAEVDRSASKFLAMMPPSGRFREAAEADVNRRRRSSAKFHPAITDIRFARNGTVFIRGGPDPDEGTVRWDVFTRDFAPIAFFILDDADRLLMIDGDSLLIARQVTASSKQVVWTMMRRPN